MRMILSGAFVLSLLPALARADDKPDPKALVEKAMKAQGGADKLGDIKSATIKWKATLPDGRVFLNTMSIQPPHRIRMVMEEQGGKKEKRVEILNGDKGHIQQDGKTADMSEERVTDLRERVHRMKVTAMIGKLEGPSYHLTALGESKAAKHTVEGIKVTSKGHPDIKMFFDKDSGLLVKAETKVHNRKDGKQVDQETLYSDYKDIGNGLKRPMTVRFFLMGKPSRQVEVIKYTLHTENHPDEHFAKP